MDSVVLLALVSVIIAQHVVILSLLARVVPKKPEVKVKKEEKKPVGHFGGRP